MFKLFNDVGGMGRDRDRDREKEREKEEKERESERVRECLSINSLLDGRIKLKIFQLKRFRVLPLICYIKLAHKF